MFDTVYFLGEYERAVTDIISNVVEKDFVCIDAGANFGWYATLLSKIGVKKVHAFEPVPPTFADLKENYELAGKPLNLVLNNLALGNEVKNIELHIFDDVPNGHASISKQGKKDFKTFTAKMITLDYYLAEHEITRVDFIKVDVEGAELFFLDGAKSVFRQKMPPVMMIEMALETSRHFGYIPQKLIEFIESQADYDFYAVDDHAIKLREIKGFAENDIGANVLCVPKTFNTFRLKKFIQNG